MSNDINTVEMLVRREIEALIAVPLIKAFIKEFGKEKSLQTAREVIIDMAKQSGAMLAELAGGNQLDDLEKALPLFSQGGALDVESIDTGKEDPSSGVGEVSFKVTRCSYAEMYKKHGLEEFGFLLSCGRDYALFEGFNPDVKLTRTHTIMEGEDYCDFCLSYSKK
ncbi:MAG: L-2-amino-thiazoline-4-carboxylic acid hydrolase [Desulfobacula sp.]|nr:L-2-amino-thiazoline-4-carboxylic acid hydrolase [Desulfobacula sp.]